MSSSSSNNDQKQLPNEETWWDYASSPAQWVDAAYKSSRDAVVWLANATHLDLGSITPTLSSTTTTTATTANMSKVEISKKPHVFCKKGGREVDWKKVAQHLDRLHHKVQRNFDTFKATSGGQEHSLRSKKHPAAKAPAATTPAGSAASDVPLTDESEELWHGAISFGGQTIQVDFDTGSSDVSGEEGAESN
jgi:hypothetical protein